ncbi:bifunctional phosphoribosylaminoimidazolecarboxamide formyltransferase/IMP cyclohydrolase, partial [bacterium]|nr:bifunctional phosphoribosylaminoimidazolecarboxamide formyltransferase/IMP cyclohydrolase [bacterium]
MKEYKFEKIKDLHYGENPHQSAALYKAPEMVDYEVLFDKELSYDNILNIYELSRVLSEFYDVNAVGIIKHQTGCGVALGRTTEEAYTKAFDCDPVSAFYGTIGFTQELDYDTAKHIDSMGVKALVAPDFHPKALEVLKENPQIKLVKVNTPLKDIREMCKEEITITPFGVLIQEK